MEHTVSWLDINGGMYSDFLSIMKIIHELVKKIPKLFDTL